MSLISNFGKVATGVLLAGSMLASTALPAWAQQYTNDKPLKVALVVHGTLGDKSFFDSAAAGLRKADEELPVELKIIEAGADKSKWQPALADAADSGYDVVIVGTFEMSPFVPEIAAEYPDEKFVIFDDTVDFAKCDCSNVVGIQYYTSTAGYLAGYAAAKISKTGKLGTIVGMEGPTVLDFKVGFDQGAKVANPNVEILNQVAGTFTDPAKGKEIALAQFNQGVDIVFPIAGGTGIGALQAAKDSGKLAIGVDSDQAAIFAPTDPGQADVIFTSVEKRIGESLYLLLKNTIDGTQEYGKTLILGLQDNAVGLSMNAQYEKLVPADVRAEVDALQKQIVDGTITVDTVMK